MLKNFHIHKLFLILLLLTGLLIAVFSIIAVTSTASAAYGDVTAYTCDMYSCPRDWSEPGAPYICQLDNVFPAASMCGDSVNCGYGITCGWVSGGYSYQTILTSSCTANLFGCSIRNCQNTSPICGSAPGNGNGSSGPGSHSACPSDNHSGYPLIKSGSSGSYVKYLQSDLNTVRGAGLTVDGAFGPLTRAAVIAYQTSEGIGADGIVGPITWGRLDDDVNATCGGNGNGNGALPSTYTISISSTPTNINIGTSEGSGTTSFTKTTETSYNGNFNLSAPPSISGYTFSEWVIDGIWTRTTPSTNISLNDTYPNRSAVAKYVTSGPSSSPCERCSNTFTEQCVSWTNPPGVSCSVVTFPVNRWFDPGCTIAIGYAEGPCPGSVPSLPPASIGSFTTTPSVVIRGLTPGGGTTLNWSTTNAVSCTINGGGVGTSGPQFKSIGADASFTLICFNADNAATAPWTVNVNFIIPAPEIHEFIATPGVVFKGGETTLSWIVRNIIPGDTGCSINNGIGSVPVDSSGNGRITATPPSGTVTYTLFCSNESGGEGGTASTSLTVTVPFIEEVLP